MVVIALFCKWPLKSLAEMLPNNVFIVSLAVQIKKDIFAFNGV